MYHILIYTHSLVGWSAFLAQCCASDVLLNLIPSLLSDGPLLLSLRFYLYHLPIMSGGPHFGPMNQ